MIAILTDKPSVGKEIGRIIGATRVRNGYVEGNGYMVTWTFGNMLSLAMPKDYGTQKLERNDFPFIPSEFELMVRHTRTENGWIPEIDAVLQLKVIERVFQACDTIIAATDASRDGEMTFRYVYQYLNCTQPCFRLWISSLTDESVRQGMENLKPDSCYDSLFLAADSRNKADWILGINASYAMCKATGLGNNSLGRVQTPVLAAISRRYRERENHISSDSWPIYISLQKDGILFKMRRTQDLPDKESATMFFQDCKLAHQAQIYNPQIQFSPKSETKRPKIELPHKTKRSKNHKRTTPKMQPFQVAFLVSTNRLKQALNGIQISIENLCYSNKNAYLCLVLSHPTTGSFILLFIQHYVCVLGRIVHVRIELRLHATLERITQCSVFAHPLTQLHNG